MSNPTFAGRSRLPPAVATPASGRAQSLRSLSEGVLDLLIIGGGIVGAGVARDAAMRGLRVAVVDRHDFAFGTSSRSSRLLHGGVRYLAQGRVGLVWEASREKKILHRIAPHLAEPLPFIFPTYEGNAQWPLWQLKIGVKIYDLLCRGRNFGPSTWLGRGETMQKVPALLRDGLQGAVRYYDGFTNDARLVLDTLRSAVRSGASAVNYCRFEGAAAGPVWKCRLTDQLAGGEHIVGARAIVNATGPWAEGLSHSRVKLRLTKGIHIVVASARLPVRETVVMADGQRILFAIPWGERTLLGTTDTDYGGAPEEVRAEAAEIEYVLRITNHFFPRANLGSADVGSAWAGLRPLIADPNGKPADISRAHEIRSPEPGWWDVAGGKLTTYRLMAEQTVDRVAGWMAEKGPPARAVGPCRTADEELLPVEETEGLSGILPPEFSRRAIEHYCANEWAIHLDDVMVRRGGWHHYRSETARLGTEAAGWMGACLNWSAETRAAELARYCRLVVEGPGRALTATLDGIQALAPQLENP